MSNELETTIREEENVSPRSSPPPRACKFECYDQPTTNPTKKQKLEPQPSYKPTALPGFPPFYFFQPNSVNSMDGHHQIPAMYHPYGGSLFADPAVFSQQGNVNPMFFTNYPFSIFGTQQQLQNGVFLPNSESEHSWSAIDTIPTRARVQRRRSPANSMNIEQALKLFLEEQRKKVKDRTYRQYETVTGQFRSYVQDEGWKQLGETKNHSDDQFTVRFGADAVPGLVPHFHQIAEDKRLFTSKTLWKSSQTVMKKFVKFIKTSDAYAHQAGQDMLPGIPTVSIPAGYVTARPPSPKPHLASLASLTSFDDSHSHSHSSPSPRRQQESPRRLSDSPQGRRSESPSESPERRSESSQGRSESPQGRSESPQGRSESPQRRSSSHPNSPHGHPASPRHPDSPLRHPDSTRFHLDSTLRDLDASRRLSLRRPPDSPVHDVNLSGHTSDDDTSNEQTLTRASHQLIGRKRSYGPGPTNDETEILDECSSAGEEETYHNSASHSPRTHSRSPSRSRSRSRSPIPRNNGGYNYQDDMDDDLELAYGRRDEEYERDLKALNTVLESMAAENYPKRHSVPTKLHGTFKVIRYDRKDMVLHITRIGDPRTYNLRLTRPIPINVIQSQLRLELVIAQDQSERWLLIECKNISTRNYLLPASHHMF